MRASGYIFLHLLALAMLATLLAGHAIAAPLVLASTSPDVRFMPLDRNAQQAKIAVRTPRTSRQRSGLHSDRKAIDKGFMRIDRTMLVVNRSKPRNVATPLRANTETAGLMQPESETLNDDPILDLFGSDGATGATFGVTQRGSAQAHARTSPYAWPVSSSVAQRISSGYGTRNDPFTGKPTFHAGIDIAAAIGTPVLATASGTVQDVGVSKRYGKFVSIKHTDGNVSWYGHLSAQTIAKGATVRKGQAIGRIGSTGRSTGPHLDFRIKDGDTFVNPETLIGEGPSTLQVAQTSLTR
jgi:murein DD-endopeptidase MepM/ murein hydrolase activator NlpD